MNIIVDIGNSRVKLYAVEGRRVVGEHIAEQPTEEWLSEVLRGYPDAERAIVASTRGDAERVAEILQRSISYVQPFSSGVTEVPIANDYLTPTTLGPDRLAAAVGAWAMYPDSDIMVVDFGTAITIDYVEEGRYKGGNISLGVSTRFRALHDYTAKLPECEPTDEVLEYGRTTKEAIEQGVMRGVEQEIRGYVERFLLKNRKKCIIFTGGDAKYFVKRIKNAIFADCEPVVYGLSAILDYNAEKR
ncbi:MAG: type III pantothenate kinase [Alistipes sp.]|nr:type III pantothenate kinase [Alistipes sp.]